MRTFECDSGSDLCVGTSSSDGRVGIDPRTDHNGIAESTRGWTRPVLTSHGHRPKKRVERNDDGEERGEEGRRRSEAQIASSCVRIVSRGGLISMRVRFNKWFY